MNKHYLLGFLLLLTSTIGMLPGTVFANETLDTDGDGVLDVMDRCPTQSETWNRYMDYDGCPDILPTMDLKLDTDGDTIYDNVDVCPNEKETWNKYNDHDGCPDIAPEQSRYKHDADLDNIINDNDMCPLDPEDYDGDRDLDGCPDQ